MIDEATDQLILSCHAAFRPFVRRLIETLQAMDWQPKIVYAWRSLVTQGNLVKSGNSRVRFSFHCAQTPEGSPAALAVDIIDRRYAWNGKSARDFFADLRIEARKLGLISGADWDDDGLDDLLESHGTTLYDAAHVQLLPNSKLKDVRAGWLPPDDYQPPVKG